jgi:hypothetical protein
MEPSGNRPSFNGLFSIGPLKGCGKSKLKWHRRRGASALPLDWNRPCCKKNCTHWFDNPVALEALLKWRSAWCQLGQARRRCAVLELIRNQTSNGSVGQGMAFLGRVLCSRAFRRLTGVSANLLSAACRWARIGALRPPEHKRLHTKQIVMDAMHGATVEIMNHMRNRMPLKSQDPDATCMPFSHPIQLYRMLIDWCEHSLRKGQPLLQRPPRYSTFKQVMRRAEFKQVRWHRIVDLGRCPKCLLYVYKSMTASEAGCLKHVIHWS